MKAHVTVWTNKAGTVTLYLSGGGVTSNMDLTPEQAKELISDLGRAIDSLPRVASADDLGLEAA